MTPLEFVQSLAQYGLSGIDSSANYQQISQFLRTQAQHILTDSANKIKRKEWIEWNGLEHGPLAFSPFDDCMVKVMHADNTISAPEKHSYWSWEALGESSDIIAYWIY